MIAFLIDMIPARIWGKEYKKEFDTFFMTFKTYRASGEEVVASPQNRYRPVDEDYESLVERYGTVFDPKDMTPDEKTACDKLKKSFFADLGLLPDGSPGELWKGPPKVPEPQRNNPVIVSDGKEQ